MIRDNVKISLDADGAVQEELSANFVYELGFNIPSPKLTTVEVPGRNGAIDLTEAYGGVFYNNRTVALSLFVKDGATGDDAVCGGFISKYHGRAVRIYVGTSYYFRGRCSAITDNLSAILRHLSVTVDADPLKYDADYTPSSSGLTLNPDGWGNSRWSTANVSTSDSGATVTWYGGTIDANTSKATFTVSASAIAAHSAVMIEFKDDGNDYEIESITGRTVKLTQRKYIVPAFAGDLSITIRRSVTTAISFHAAIYEIAATQITNTGQSAAVEILNSYTTLSGDVYLVLNSTLTRLAISGFTQYPQLILPPGSCYALTFVDNSSFTPPSIHGNIKLRYRRGVI